MLRNFEHQTVAAVLGLDRIQNGRQMSSNCTSTTAPMTCVMRPVWLAGVAMKTLSFEFYLKRPSA